jgi:uncharacterized protein (DUF362 family)
MKITESKVAIVRCPGYDQDLVDEAVAQAVELAGNAERFIKKGDTVLLKVNLLIPKAPEFGVTTHPSVAAALAKLAFRCGAGEVLIGDSSMWQTGRALKICGMEQAAADTGAKAVNLETAKSKKMPIGNAKILKEVIISQTVLDADVVFSVSKLKAHELTLFTGAVKNMFGAIPGRTKSNMHKLARSVPDFCDLLIDLYSKVTPDFCLMDGIESIEGSAGMGGRTKKLGVVLASDNGFALDTVAAKIIGCRAGELPLNKAARLRGIIGTRMSEINVVGESISTVRNTRFKKPSFISRFSMSRSEFNPVVWGKQLPVANESKCVKCGICADVCPVGAIAMRDYPVFDHNKCMQCFCCREGCREGAVELKESLMFRLLQQLMEK